MKFKFKKKNLTQTSPRPTSYAGRAREINLTPYAGWANLTRILQAKHKAGHLHFHPYYMSTNVVFNTPIFPRSK